MLLRRLMVAAVFFVAVVVGGGSQSPHSASAAAVRTWTGGGANSNWTTAANWGGTAPVAGDVLTFPAGAARLSNTNDFATGTSFDQILLTGGGYTLAGNRLSLATGLRASNAVNTTNVVSLAISGSGGVTLSGSGRVDLSGGNSFAGNVYVDRGQLRVKSATALGSASGITEVSTTAEALWFEGTFALSESIFVAQTPSGSLIDVSGGHVTINSDILVDGTSTAFNVLADGQLTINGNIATGFFKYGGGALFFNGNVSGPVTVSDGSFDLNGNSTSGVRTSGRASLNGAVSYVQIVGIGQLSLTPDSVVMVSNEVTFSAASTLRVNLFNPLTEPLPQMTTAAPPTLASAHFVLAANTPGPPGAVYTIIKNTSSQPLDGTFAGLPEGSNIVAGGYTFRISYIGGDGNDLTLRVVSASAPESADLRLSASAAPEPAAAGGNVTYTVQVTNGGPSDAHDVVLTMQVVAGSSFVNLDANPNWTCTLPAVGATGQVSCFRDVLANGGASTLTLTVRIDSGRTANVVTPFSVSASTADPAMSNNDTSVTTHIGTVASPPTPAPGPGTAMQYRRFVMQVAQD